MTTRSRLEVELATRRYTRRHAREIVTAILGNNAGTVVAVADTRWYWIRLHGDPNQVVRAWNTAFVPPIANLPVDIEIVKVNGLTDYQIIGVSLSRGVAADVNAGATGSHALQHQRRDFNTGGFDPLDIYARSIVQLRARAQATPNMTLYVEPGFYPVAGIATYFAGGNSPAFVAPAGNFRCDLLYLDNTGTLQIVTGTVVPLGTPPRPAQPAATDLPLAYVYLTATTTAITEYIIEDARVIFGTMPATMTPSAHNVLSASHGDTLTGSVVDGDTIIGNVTPKWSRLAISIPAAGVLNYLGVNNGELRPSWKSASSNPGAAAAILATDASGYIYVLRGRFGSATAPAYPLDVTGSGRFSGNVHIGFSTVDANTQLYQSAIHTVTSGTKVSWSTDTYIRPTASSTATFWGISPAIIYDSANNSGNIYCNYIRPIFGASAGGTVSSVYGSYVRPDRFAGGTGTWTNFYAYAFSPGTITGNFITNFYGLYIDNLTWGGTLNYSIYTNAAANGARFGHQLALVGSTDVQQLTVTGFTTQAVATSLVQFTRNDATAGISAMLGLTALGSGANGDGGSVLLNGKSSTTTATAMGLLAYSWVDATHATRKAKLVLSVYDTAVREALTLEADGAAADVYFSGGDGSGLPYGSCSSNDTDINWTQASAAQNTWYDISDADMVDGQLNLVTHDGNGQLTVVKGGRYKIDYTITFEVNANNTHVETAISINGTESTQGIGHQESRTANTEYALAGTAILDLAAASTVNLSIRTTDNTTPNFKVEMMDITLVQVGGT